MGEDGLSDRSNRLGWKPRFEWPQGEENFKEAIAQLKSETGLTELTLRVCLQRGLLDSNRIQSFLFPKLDQLTDPMKIKGMEEALKRLSQARSQKEKVRIFGDYDVDGTCGAALLTWCFREHGIIADAVQPDRFKDGYGLNAQAVQQAFDEGLKLIVTVDCGITSFEAAEKAQELGVDLVILDHHQIDPIRGIPKALAVLNPQRADCPSGLKQLCGCGVAFYLTMALRAHGRKESWFGPGQEPNLKSHLDLVVIATAADMVPLVGDNRILVRHGMEVLKGSKKPGVKALLEAAGLSTRSVSPSHLGFVLGPRINASGRMQSASLALELLTTEDPQRATELALTLERLNQERADVQNQIWDEVRARVQKAVSEGRYPHGIVVADEGWHEGVVGIVASRVTETFKRPAVVIAIREDFAKGSVRSFGGKDVLSALRQSADHLLGFGGHRHAAGLSLRPEKLIDFENSFNQALSQIPEEQDGRALLLEGQCTVDDLNVKTLQELESLGPFGVGNPEPVFSLPAKLVGHRVLKDRHLKLTLSGAGNARSKTVEAMWFNAAEKLQASELVEEGEWAGVPELNRFRGSVTPTLRVKGFRPRHS